MYLGTLRAPTVEQASEASQRQVRGKTLRAPLVLCRRTAPFQCFFKFTTATLFTLALGRRAEPRERRRRHTHTRYSISRFHGHGDSYRLGRWCMLHFFFPWHMAGLLQLHAAAAFFGFRALTISSPQPLIIVFSVSELCYRKHTAPTRGRAPHGGGGIQPDRTEQR